MLSFDYSNPALAKISENLLTPDPGIELSYFVRYTLRMGISSTNAFDLHCEFFINIQMVVDL